MEKVEGRGLCPDQLHSLLLIVVRSLIIKRNVFSTVAKSIWSIKDTNSNLHLVEFDRIPPLLQCQVLDQQALESLLALLRFLCPSPLDLYDARWQFWCQKKSKFALVLVSRRPAKRFKLNFLLYWNPLTVLTIPMMLLLLVGTLHKH